MSTSSTLHGSYSLRFPFLCDRDARKPCWSPSLCTCWNQTSTQWQSLTTCSRHQARRPGAIGQCSVDAFSAIRLQMLCSCLNQALYVDGPGPPAPRNCGRCGCIVCWVAALPHAGYCCGCTVTALPCFMGIGRWHHGRNALGLPQAKQLIPKRVVAARLSAFCLHLYCDRITRSLQCNGKRTNDTMA
jgi:hypothetical protein